MQIIRTKSELQKAISLLRESRKTIGFVPTMGALHEGHLSLVDIAKKNSDIVVVSIFVNPAQFAPNEDFDKYPRQEQEDLAKLEKRIVDIAYLPSRNEIYTENSSTVISVGDIGRDLEGISRPHFFDGVALVVTKLFMQINPDIAVFGEKDYQQLVIIKQMTRELDINVKIIGAPVCREKDGLAMSSRNVYLPADKRHIAANLYKILNEVKVKLIAGEKAEKALQWGRKNLLSLGFESVDYLELRHAATLAPIANIKSPARLLAVARLAGIRLLDNIEIC